MSTREIMLFAGTRPEAIKLAPLALAAATTELSASVIAVGQQPGMVAQGLKPFGLVPDLQIDFVRTDGSLSELCALMMPAIDALLADREPAAVVVQGDTATTLVCALAAFWRRIPLVHLEAGLRTGDLASPFPEEANRQLVSRIASLHLAPTRRAEDALLAEGVPPGNVVMTGNTVVDAVRHIAALDVPPRDSAIVGVAGARGPLVLVTVHRRESWGEGIHNVLEAVRDVVRDFPDARVVLPAHPNPSVHTQVLTVLGDHPNVTITKPLDYPDLVWTLRRSALVITDSGGIQEEAPTFRVPVLVARGTTERREAVETGFAQLVGTDRATIAEAARNILGNGWALPFGSNPFGEGDAAERSLKAIGRMLGLDGRRIVACSPGAAERAR
ncbi:MAG: UDP-N-acetylglucosamine 2-epimerase (non-hydrolyzing) [Actinomycetota bacterium]|nr:UDP-N-acetylglucosamine 2-epimerase (non-hydrolyzing) [Actinomycetota bacterium]